MLMYGGLILMKNKIKEFLKPKPMTPDDIATVIERLTGADLSQLLDHADGVTLQISKGDQVLFTGEYIADDWYGKTYLKGKEHD